MKKLLLMLPIFLFAFTSKYTPCLNIFLAPIKCSKVLHKKAFDICYSFKKKEPLVVAYDLTKNNEEKCDIPRKGLHFKAAYNIPRSYRAYPSDYTHRKYDRGHNAPNGNFNYNSAIQKQTFLMSNIAPQAKWLNRVYWTKVEKLARDKAIEYGKVEVVTGNCGSIGHLKNNVNIPKYWFKIIDIPSQNKILYFLVPNINKGMKKADLYKYSTTADNLIKHCIVNRPSFR